MERLKVISEKLEHEKNSELFVICVSQISTLYARDPSVSHAFMFNLIKRLLVSKQPFKRSLAASLFEKVTDEIIASNGSAEFIFPESQLDFDVLEFIESLERNKRDKQRHENNYEALAALDINKLTRDAVTRFLSRKENYLFSKSEKSIQAKEKASKLRLSGEHDDVYLSQINRRIERDQDFDFSEREDSVESKPQLKRVKTSEAETPATDKESKKRSGNMTTLFDSVYKIARYLVFHVNWELRHGALLIFRAISRKFGSIVFVSNLDNVEFEVSVERDTEGRLVRVNGKSMNEMSRMVNEDIKQKCVFLLALDRFSDFLNDKSNMTHRSLAAEILVTLFGNVPNIGDFYFLFEFLFLPMRRNEWEPKQALIFLFKKIIERDSQSKVEQRIIGRPFIERIAKIILEVMGEHEEVTDIAAQFGTALLESEMWPISANYSQLFQKALLSQLNNIDDIGYLPKAVFEHFSTLLQVNQLCGDVVDHLEELLRKFVFHNNAEVRIEVLRFVSSLIKLNGESANAAKTTVVVLKQVTKPTYKLIYVSMVYSYILRRSSGGEDTETTEMASIMTLILQRIDETELQTEMLMLLFRIIDCRDFKVAIDALHVDFSYNVERSLEIRNADMLELTANLMNGLELPDVARVFEHIESIFAHSRILRVAFVLTRHSLVSESRIKELLDATIDSIRLTHFDDKLKEVTSEVEEFLCNEMTQIQLDECPRLESIVESVLSVVEENTKIKTRLTELATLIKRLNEEVIELMRNGKIAFTKSNLVMIVERKLIPSLAEVIAFGDECVQLMQLGGSSGYLEECVVRADESLRVKTAECVVKADNSLRVKTGECVVRADESLRVKTGEYVIRADNSLRVKTGECVVKAEDSSRVKTAEYVIDSSMMNRLVNPLISILSNRTTKFLTSLACTSLFKLIRIYRDSVKHPNHKIMESVLRRASESDLFACNVFEYIWLVFDRYSFIATSQLPCLNSIFENEQLCSAFIDAFIAIRNQENELAFADIILQCLKEQKYTTRERRGKIMCRLFESLSGHWRQMNALLEWLLGQLKTKDISAFESIQTLLTNSKKAFLPYAKIFLQETIKALSRSFEIETERMGSMGSMGIETDDGTMHEIAPREQVEKSAVFDVFCTMLTLSHLDLDTEYLSPDLVALSKESNRFLFEFRNPRNFEIDISPVLSKSVKLRDYQVEGIKWISFLFKYGLSCCLCDDMGLGKTVQSLCAVAISHLQPSTTRPISLVVCPNSLIVHWLNECTSQILATRLNACLVLSSSLSEKVSFREYASKHEDKTLFIMSYNTLNKVLKYMDYEFKVIVADEAHLIKNPKSKTAASLKMLRSELRLCLTGTPIQNKVTELWSIFDFLTPMYLGRNDEFNREFKCLLEMSMLSVDVSKMQLSEHQDAILQKLHRRVLPFIMRREKHDVLSDLPDKIIQDYNCEMTDTQRLIYEHYDKEVEESKNCFLTTLSILRRVLNHPCLVAAHSGKKKTKTSQTTNTVESILAKLPKVNSQAFFACSGKFIALRELMNSLNFWEDDVASCVRNENKMLLFTRSNETLQLIEKFTRATFPFIKSLTMSHMQSNLERAELVAKFNSSTDIKLLLLTPKIGGLGLNLSSANVVIMFDHDFNPMNDLQAMDRAHRLGQKNTVNVYRMITLDTIEEKIMGIQRFKVSVANTVVNADNTSIRNVQESNFVSLIDNFAQENIKKKENEEKGFVDCIDKYLKNSDLEELWDEKEYAMEYL